MSEPQSSPFAVAEREAKVMEYIPFGAQDKIKLSVQIVQNLIAVPTRSGKTCSERDALKFMAMCQAKRLNPFEGDSFLIGYDGQNGAQFSLITAHQAFLKRAEIHPEYDGMKSGIIIYDDGKLIDIEGDFHLENQKVVGGWATVYFKNRKHPTTRRIRLERFNNGFAQWKVDPAGMICKCAEADSLRSSFPTMLGGLYMREEVEVFIGPSTTALPAIARPTFDVPAGEDESAEAAAGLAPEQPKGKNKAKAKAEMRGEGASSEPHKLASPGATPGPAPTTAPTEPRQGHDAPEPPADAPVIDRVLYLCGRDGINETEVLEILKRKKLARPEWQQLVEVNDEHLKDVISSWDVVSAQVRIDRKAAAK